MLSTRHHHRLMSRREFLRAGVLGFGVGTTWPFVFEQTLPVIAAKPWLTGREPRPERILVILELAGGNDGLNTVIPWSHDLYHRRRPTLAIPEAEVIKLNDALGLHPALIGLKRLWDEGRLAIVPGCGYPNPSRSHSISMAYWHTAGTHATESPGWVGRLAEAQCSGATTGYMVNIIPTHSLALWWHQPPGGEEPISIPIAQGPSLAVKSYLHTPIRVSDTNLLTCAQSSRSSDHNAAALTFARNSPYPSIAHAAVVREAIATYRTSVHYGAEDGSLSLASDLKKVAAVIHAGLPPRIYYLSFGGFDTHVNQKELHRAFLRHLGDALAGFFQDLDRIGRGSDVALMMFSEFGRRLKENNRCGTDHGAAGPMFVIGRKVKGGLYGAYPSLSDPDAYGGLKMTVDFRQVYATMIQEWMGCPDAATILRGHFPALGMFA